MKLVLIPPGEFMMGSSKLEQQWAITQPSAKRFFAGVKAIGGGVVPQDWVKPEGPQHRVRLSPPILRGDI